MNEFLEENTKKHNKFQWFLAVIVIPTLFALVVAAIVASFAGVDVWGKVTEYSEKIPFIASDEGKSVKQKTEELEMHITDLNAEIEFRDDTITVLESDIDRKQQEIEELTLEKEQLEKQMEDLMNAEGNVNETQTLNEITRTFENMSARKAAPILESMNENDALMILSSLKSDTLGALLEKMNPEVAAKFTTLLTNNTNEG